MNDEELILRAPHTKEVDGELIPDFAGAPKVYNPEGVAIPTYAMQKKEYQMIGDKYRRRVSKYKKLVEKERIKRLENDPVRQMIEKMNTKLTPSERDILYILRMFQWEERYSPTSWEMSMILGTSTSYFRQVVKSLVTKGVIEQSPHPIEKRYMTRILFPRGMWWPWHDYTQFPPALFWDKNEERYGDIAKKAHELGLK